MRTDKRIIVDYKKHWGESGTCYSQTIQVNKKFIKYVNKEIKNYWKSDENIKSVYQKSVGFSSYYDCYLKEINIKEKIVFLNLTQLQFIYFYLSLNNYDVSRIKYRNTLLKII